MKNCDKMRILKTHFIGQIFHKELFIYLFYFFENIVYLMASV